MYTKERGKGYLGCESDVRSVLALPFWTFFLTTSQNDDVVDDHTLCMYICVYVYI